MKTIGTVSERQSGNTLLARSRARAALIPDLLVEAKRVANNVFAGWHGRKRRGVGENFWQFRPYVAGENYAAIDWRRSARDDHVYIRDKEWQAAHTIWLWVDESPSMLYKSETAQVPKQSRAMVIALALAELLARNGERVGWLGVSPPIVHRHAAERLAAMLVHSEPKDGIPLRDEIRDFAEVVLISDFLDPENSVISSMNQISKKRIRGHLVQIIDPAEQNFPYSGRVEFKDPESGIKLNFGSAQALQSDYQALFAAHTDSIGNFARPLGWSHTIHQTDKLASQALQSLHVQLSASHNFSGGTN